MKGLPRTCDLSIYSLVEPARAARAALKSLMSSECRVDRFQSISGCQSGGDPFNFRPLPFVISQSVGAKICGRTSAPRLCEFEIEDRSIHDDDIKRRTTSNLPLHLPTVTGTHQPTWRTNAASSSTCKPSLCPALC